MPIPGLSTGGGSLSTSSSATASGKSGDIITGATTFNFGRPPLNNTTTKAALLFVGVVGLYLLYKNK